MMKYNVRTNHHIQRIGMLSIDSTYKKIVIHLRTSNAHRFCDFLYFHNFNNSKNNCIYRNNCLFIHDYI